MTISIQTANRVCVLVVLALLGVSGRAQAACIDGTTAACTVNGHPGERECINGVWSPCLTDEPSGPPPLAGPTLPSRTSTTLTLSRSGTRQAGEQYQFQTFAAGAWVGLAAIGTPPTYVHSGLQPDKKYCYRVQATGTYGTRSSPSNCRYTTDGTGRKAWRVQVEFQTADVEDAGTDDGVNVVLTESGGNHTWVDYGRDDFERGDTLKYDLGLERIEFFSDINRIRIEKTGTNGWCVSRFRLFVNDRLAYTESFQSLPSGCRWIDGNDGHQPAYEVNHATLRANADWLGYVEPQRLAIDASGYPQITATLSIQRAEAESRLESMIGDLIHGTEAHWGDRHGARYVEASWAGYPGRVHMDLDLEASVDGWFDPELDIDFDLRYEARCSADQTAAIVDVTTENLQANVDFDWFAEFWSFILPCGPIASIATDQGIPDCIAALEDYIGERIEAGFEPIVQSQRQSLPQGVRCLSAEVLIDADANVDLVFHVEAPPPTPVVRVLPVWPRW